MNDILEKFFNKEWQEFILFHSEVKKFEKNEVIFTVGDKTHGIFIINSGIVKVTTDSGNNSERIIRISTDNDIIGHRGFGGTWKYTVTATTLVDTELLFIPLNIFKIIFEASSEFGYFMMMFFANQLRESEHLASQMPMRNIIASVLYRNLKVFGYKKNSKKLRYTLTRKDLASQAGTRYETLVRTLADFNNEKIIKIDGKEIHILDEERLFRISEGEE